VQKSVLLACLVPFLVNTLLHHGFIIFYYFILIIFIIKIAIIIIAAANSMKTVQICWLVPCILSFISSCFLILNVLFTPGAIKQVFQQLSMLLAICDLIQTSATFLGNSDSMTYVLCCVQNYMLQVGVTYKASAVLLISGLSLFITNKLRIPTNIPMLVMLALTVASILLAISLWFQTANVYCYEEDFDLENASHKLKRSAYVLLLAIFGPLYLSILALTCICIAIERKFVNMKRPFVQFKDLLLQRLRLYPSAFVLCLLPGTVEFVLSFMSYAIGSSKVLSYLTGICVSSNGLLMSAAYFYYQKNFPPFILVLFGYPVDEGVEQGLVVAYHNESEAAGLHVPLHHRDSSLYHGESTGGESGSGPRQYLDTEFQVEFRESSTVNGDNEE
jgi:hypothetical protein